MRRGTMSTYCVKAGREEEGVVSNDVPSCCTLTFSTYVSPTINLWAMEVTRLQPRRLHHYTSWWL